MVMTEHHQSGSLVFSGGGDKHESTILFKSNEVSTDFGYLKYMSTYLDGSNIGRIVVVEATANNGINTDSICLMACAGLGQPINSFDNPTGVSGSVLLV
jgi:hypothetical protein